MKNVASRWSAYKALNIVKFVSDARRLFIYSSI